MSAIGKVGLLGRVLQTDCEGEYTPLRGLFVDAYTCTIARDVPPVMAKLNEAAAKTDEYGFFAFEELDSERALPAGSIDLDAIRVAADAEDTEDDGDDDPFSAEDPADSDLATTYTIILFRVTHVVEVEGTARPGGETALVVSDLFDERQEVNDAWLRANPRRLVRWTRTRRKFFRRVRIPANRGAAAALAGDTTDGSRSLASLATKGNQFTFIGIGRASIDEIGVLGDPRPEFEGKPGYYRSANTWKNPPTNFGSELPDRYDAPFGGVLQLKGVFGGDLPLKDNLYYSLKVSQYTGDISKPLDPSKLTKTTTIASNTFASYFEFYAAGSKDGKWKSVQLGPYRGTANGEPVTVYRRFLPGPTTKEAWPDPFLLCSWETRSRPDGLNIVTIELYERVGGTDASPVLQSLPLDAGARTWITLLLDNSTSRIRFDKFYPEDPTSFVKLQTAFCTFGGGAVEAIGTPTDVGECNEVPVVPGQTDGNEGILLRFSLYDLRTNAVLKHPKEYRLTAEYTPRSTSESPDNKLIDLKPRFADAEPLKQEYRFVMTADAQWPIDRRLCALVPQLLDGWPPEKGDPNKTPCSQYGVALKIEAYSRPINGYWEVEYKPITWARYIVLRNASAKCS